MADNNTPTTTHTLTVPLGDEMREFIKARQLMTKIEDLLEGGYHPASILMALANVCKNPDNFIPEDADDETVERYERAFTMFSNTAQEAADKIIKYTGVK